MQTKLKNRKGFTIIEVMIVLAIAGLIMLIVFLAVPALQRSSRNTSRKNDSARLSTSISSFVSNANGDLPCMGTTSTFNSSSTDAATVLADAGKLGQLAFTAGSACSTSGTPVANTFTVTNATPGSAPAAADNEVVAFLGSTCSGLYAVAGSARQVALTFPVESSSGYTWSCISAL